MLLVGFRKNIVEPKLCSCKFLPECVGVSVAGGVAQSSDGYSEFIRLDVDLRPHVSGDGGQLRFVVGLVLTRLFGNEHEGSDLAVSRGDGRVLGVPHCLNHLAEGVDLSGFHKSEAFGGFRRFVVNMLRGIVVP